MDGKGYTPVIGIVNEKTVKASGRTFLGTILRVRTIFYIDTIKTLG